MAYIPPYGEGSSPYNDGFPPGMMKPDSYLVWTILSTIVCCIPVGAFGIYFSTQVDRRWSVGDFNGALDASNKAKTFAIASAVTGIVLGILYVALLGFAGRASV